MTEQVLTHSIDLNSVFSTVVGGAITLLATVLTWHLSNKSAHRKQQEEQRKAEASQALSGYFKLQAWTNLIQNIGRLVDNAFDQSNEAGLQSTEAYAYVPAGVGKFLEPERLTASEYSFLLDKDSYELLEHVLLVEARAISLHAILDKYSELRLELEHWLEKVQGVKRGLTDRVAVDMIPLEHATNFELRAAKLNLLIWEIIEKSSEDGRFAFVTTKRYLNVAHRRLQPEFPKIEITVAPPPTPPTEASTPA